LIQHLQTSVCLKTTKHVLFTFKNIINMFVTFVLYSCLQWHCCGVDDNGWAAYRQSNWYKDHPGANRMSLSACTWM